MLISAYVLRRSIHPLTELIKAKMPVEYAGQLPVLAAVGRSRGHLQKNVDLVSPVIFLNMFKNRKRLRLQIKSF